MPDYYRSYQRPLDENDWKSVNYELGSQYVTALSSDSLLFRHTDATADFGLPIDETAGTKQGYMIWVYSTTNTQDSAMKVKYRQVEYKIEAKANDHMISVKPDSTFNLLGGVFIVPQVERAGYIKMLLVGVVTKKSQDEWMLNLMTSKTEDLTKAGGLEKTDKSKKKKKRLDSEANPVDNSDDEELTPIK